MIQQLVQETDLLNLNVDSIEKNLDRRLQFILKELASVDVLEKDKSHREEVEEIWRKMKALVRSQG